MTCETCDQLRTLYEREKAKNQKMRADLNSLKNFIRILGAGADLAISLGSGVVSAKTLSEEIVEALSATKKEAR